MSDDDENDSQRQRAWPTLESQPAALTAFVRQIGASDDWAFVDVLSVDAAMRNLIPSSTRAFLVVLPLADWRDRATIAARAADADNVVFVKQRVANACGTIAVIHAAANNPDVLDAERSSSLLASFAAGSLADVAALAEQSDELKDAHERAAAQSVSDATGSRADLHFVCLTRRNDRLFLLDGRNDGPVALEPCTAEKFVDSSCDFIQQSLMAGTDTIAFSIVALCLAGDVIDEAW